MLMALHSLVGTGHAVMRTSPACACVLGAITTAAGAGRAGGRRADLGGALRLWLWSCWSCRSLPRARYRPDAAFALVLGANLGTAINPVLEGVSGDDPVARRLPIGNLLNRALGCVVALVLLNRIGSWLVQIEPDPVRAIADFHTGFNLILAALFLPALGPYAKILRKLLPARVVADDPSRPRYLDPTALESPPIALGAAAREALRMADALEAMLARAGEVLASTDRRRIGEVRRLDDVLDRLNTAIKGYLTALDPEDLSETDHRRLSQVLVFATNLEAAADVVDRDVMGHLAKRLKRGAPLAEPEQAAARRLLERLGATVRAAAAVFMTEDPRAARQLMAEKEAFRDLEAAATSGTFRWPPRWQEHHRSGPRPDAGAEAGKRPSGRRGRLSGAGGPGRIAGKPAAVGFLTSSYNLWNPGCGTRGEQRRRARPDHPKR